MWTLSVAKRPLFVLFLSVLLLGNNTTSSAIHKCDSLSLRRLNANTNWRQKILRIALLKSGAETSLNGNTSLSVEDEKHGVAFLLVDPNMSSMTMFISDLPSRVVPGRAVIQGEEGEAIASYLVNSTFVASNPTGLAFAGVVPLTIASIEALQANPTRFIVRLETGQEDDFAGGIMLPSQAAQLLPSILLPDALLLADPSLYSSLAISFNFYARGEMNLTVSHDPEDPRQKPVLSNITSFDLASSFRAITSALPVALQYMVAGDEGSDAEILTTLTSFLTSMIPALPALTKAIPSVKNGQFLLAGSAALMATMIAYSGFLPPLNSPRILSALSASLETALLVNQEQS